MSELKGANIIPLLRHVCLALRPFATSYKIKIAFKTNLKSVSFNYQPYEIIESLTKLICSVISYLPAKNTITVTANVIATGTSRLLQVSVHNSGINLARITEITLNSKISVTIQPSSNKQTTFLICFPINYQELSLLNERANDKSKFPLFFSEVQFRLQKYFVNLSNTEDELKEEKSKAGAFLKRVNECISQNLGDETFDATVLSQKISMSRTQLFRRLKPVIHQSAASYIKTLRLRKAKGLLEEGDLNVSEVAFITGFKTVSHFTKVFAAKYGICPSVFRKPKGHVTNE